MPVGVYPRSERQREILRKHQFKPGHNAMPPLLRFWRKVEIQENGCWLWTGCLAHPQGYGRLEINGEAIYAHRFIYEQLRGPIPLDKEIDHRCRNRACVNPWHMDIVTTGENTRRGVESRMRGFCKRGHPRNPENTYIQKDGHTRACRACHREIERIAWRKRHGQSQGM